MESISKAAAAAALALAVAGCGAQAQTAHHGGVTTERRDVQESPEISVSRVHIYSSLRDLASDTQVIARVRVVDGSTKEVPADRLGQAPEPATEVTVQVLETLKGQIPRTVPVRLITSPDDTSDVPPALAEGASYILFLNEFEWEPGQPTGEWVVPGGAGIYEVKGNGSLMRRSRGDDAIPDHIDSVAELATVAAG